MKSKSNLIKHIFSIVLCLEIVLTYIPQTVSADTNVDDTDLFPTVIQVGKVKITENNADDVLGDGTVSVQSILCENWLQTEGETI